MLVLKMKKHVYKMCMKLLFHCLNLYTSPDICYLNTNSVICLLMSDLWSEDPRISWLFCLVFQLRL